MEQERSDARHGGTGDGHEVTWQHHGQDGPDCNRRSGVAMALA